MATVYSGEVAVGTYNRIRIKCDYSGTSATLTIQFRRTSSYTATWSDSNATLTFNGQSKGAAYSYSGTVGTSWVNLRAAISGYTISTSGGTYSWTFNNPGGSSVLGCSGSITIPPQGTAPSNGYVDGLISAYNPVNGLIEFSAENAGVSSSLALTSLEFSILKVPHTTSGLPRQSISFTNDSPVMLNQENSTAQNGGVTIQGNDLYYVGIYAANSAGSYRYNGPSIVSPCKPADITLVRASDTSVSIYYAIDADGGYYTRKIEYSLDGGNSWATGDTISNGSIAGVFTVTNLDSYREYTISFRVRTDAGSTSCGNIKFALLKPKFYGPVNGLTEKTNAFYGSLNNQTKKIIKYYASENGRAKLIYKENS